MSGYYTTGSSFGMNSYYNKPSILKPINTGCSRINGIVIPSDVNFPQTTSVVISMVGNASFEETVNTNQSIRHIDYNQNPKQVSIQLYENSNSNSKSNQSQSELFSFFMQSPIQYNYFRNVYVNVLSGLFTTEISSNKSSGDPFNLTLNNLINITNQYYNTMSNSNESLNYTSLGNQNLNTTTNNQNSIVTITNSTSFSFGNSLSSDTSQKKSLQFIFSTQNSPSTTQSLGFYCTIIDNNTGEIKTIDNNGSGSANLTNGSIQNPNYIQIPLPSSSFSFSLPIFGSLTDSFSIRFYINATSVYNATVNLSMNFIEEGFGFTNISS